jgi:hypothetical protein
VRAPPSLFVSPRRSVTRHVVCAGKSLMRSNAVITHGDSSSAVLVVTVLRTDTSYLMKVTWRDDVERDEDSGFLTVERREVIDSLEAFLHRTLTR